MNLEEKQDLIEFYIKCEQLSNETKYYLLYDIIWKWKMNKEDKLVNCKNCKHFEVNKVNKDSTLFFCKLNKKNFRDENQVSSNLNCYKGKWYG